MNILVIGGAGMIGGHIALRLQGSGHNVAIAGRNPPAAGTPLGALEFERCDYQDAQTPASAFSRFDAVIFAAGNDIRHIPKDADPEQFWQRANSEAVPTFFAKLRDAGVRTAINIGSFYPQARPELVDKIAYVRSRKMADDGARALATPNFRVISLNAPFVLGSVPGFDNPLFRTYVQYAQGALPIPAFVPPGGVNFISCDSISDAVEGALSRGENGKAYLIGDENLSFQQYFGEFFQACGNAVPEVRDEEHPLLPDAAIFFGRGNTLYYEPDANETALLGYRRNDVARTVKLLVEQFRTA